MNQMRCQSCGHSLPPQAKFCPQCGEPIAVSEHASSPQDSPAPQNRQSSRRDLLIISALVLAVTVGFFIFKGPEAFPGKTAAENLSHSDVPAGDMGEAMKVLEDLPTDYGSLVVLGNKFMDEHNYAVAAECYKRALAIEGDSSDIRVDYGACLHEIGLPYRAIEQFRQVLEKNPSHDIANLNLGIVYYSLNEIDSANVYWRKCLVVEPGGRAAEAARALLKEIGE